MLSHLSPYYLTILIFTNNTPKPPSRKYSYQKYLQQLNNSCVLTHFKGTEVVLMWILLWGKNGLTYVPR